MTPRNTMFKDKKEIRQKAKKGRSRTRAGLARRMWPELE